MIHIKPILMSGIIMKIDNENRKTAIIDEMSGAEFC